MDGRTTFYSSRVVSILRHHIRYALHAGPFRRNPNLRWLVQFPQKFDLSVDVGAHHGLYSRALAAKSTKVLSIEPQWQGLTHNIHFLPLNCSPIGAALSNYSGLLTLKTPISNSRPDFALTSAEPEIHAQVPTIDWKATCTTLDQLLANLDLSMRVGFLKIDVEGHELAVLHGATATLAVDRPFVLVEAERRHGCDIEALFAFFRDHEYDACLPGQPLDHSIAFQEYLDLQVMSVAGKPDYVNNLLFVPRR